MLSTVGHPSIVFSTQVNSKWVFGEVAGAQEAEAKAKKFAIWAAIAWAVVAMVYRILVAVGMANLNFNTSASCTGW